MRTLAIETASEACSLALFEGAALIAQDTRVIGRGHAEALVPMIAGLPGRGAAARILVSLGPGSFTGVRIGLATARALGLAWGAEVLGYPTLALIAAGAQAARPGMPVTICINGGHGEWFVGDFDAAGLPQGEVVSLTPEAAHTRPGHRLVAGNRAEAWAAAHPDSQCEALTLLPDAALAEAIPACLLTRTLAPLYGRAPDATPLAGRAAS
jgi:tRNA threonylcarbamoyl adenosine modification protein YeaZ